jgi:hypothetical protein
VPTAQTERQHPDQPVTGARKAASRSA